MSAASLRINESLEFDVVLQGVLDSARSLTAARYGVMTLLNDAGQIETFLASGMTSDEARQLWDLPDGTNIFASLSGTRAPLRLPDLLGHLRSLGLPEFHPPLVLSPVVSLLAAPILHRGECVGHIYVAEQESGQAFSGVDEETLVMFAAQAALVIVNARRYRDEQRARTDLETLIDTSPVGVAVFDARTGAPVSFNREAKRIVEHLRMPEGTAEQILEVVTIRRADGRETSLSELPMAQLLSASETVRAEEIVMQVPDGRSVKALLNATPIHAEQGELESYVVTLQDLTPLQELERLRAEFLAMVSHQLRLPIISVKGSVTTLLDPAAALNPAEMVEFLRVIDSQTDRMRDLISDLLDLAWIETGTLEVAPAPTAPAALLDGARSAFLSAGARNTVLIEVPPDLPWVLADRPRIVQVLSNLLSHAAKHSPESSAIQVTGWRTDVHVAFGVANDDWGVSAERLSRLFGKFSPIEADASTSDRWGWSADLAICKGIIEAHGGRISAASKGPGEGSQISFTLPVVEQRERPVAPKPASLTTCSERRAAGGQPRILAVHEDPHALRLVRDTLAEYGYDVTSTDAPEESFQLMRAIEPELILLDLMLSGSAAIALMRRILETSEVPVIFLSIDDQDDVIATAFDLGAADYLVKPFSATELAARVRAALRKRAAPQQLAPFVLGELTVNYADRRASLADRPVPLTAIEYRMLTELAMNAGRVLSYGHLLQRVWGQERTADIRPMRTVVSSLRRKLGDSRRPPPLHLHRAPGRLLHGAGGGGGQL